MKEETIDNARMTISLILLGYSGDSFFPSLVPCSASSSFFFVPVPIFRFAIAIIIIPMQIAPMKKSPTRTVDRVATVSSNVGSVAAAAAAAAVPPPPPPDRVKGSAVAVAISLFFFNRSNESVLAVFTFGESICLF